MNSPTRSLERSTSIVTSNCSASLSARARSSFGSSSWFKKTNQRKCIRLFLNPYKRYDEINNSITRSLYYSYESCSNKRSNDFHTLDRHFWPVFLENSSNYYMDDHRGFNLDFDMKAVPIKNIVQLKKGRGTYLEFHNDLDTGIEIGKRVLGIYQDYSRKYQPIPLKILKRR